MTTMMCYGSRIAVGNDHVSSRTQTHVSFISIIAYFAKQEGKKKKGAETEHGRILTHTK
jgi:hypothetical protein